MTAPALDFDACYAAASGRDARFDGQFYLAVSSTGIYCRPSCPARTPKREHCTFYLTSAAAHHAGYRACKRCLPEAVPGSPAWDLRDDVAARAMRLIADGVVDREGVTGLAARVGYSTRQLSRLLTEQWGAGPLALARAQRAQTARYLLVSTTLGASDVAFAAGFASVRQFNDTMAEVFGMTPTAIRASARRRELAPVSGPSHVRTPNPHHAPLLTLRLPARKPFSGADVLGWLGARAIDGLEHVTSDTFTRTVHLSRGVAVLGCTPEPDAVRVRVRLAHLDDLPELLARVRRLWDLDADPVAVDTALSADPPLAGAIAAAPGLRIPGTVDPFEMLVRAVLGQQVSVASARTAVQRLVAELGEPLESGVTDTPGISLAFPTPETIAEYASGVVRGPATRTRALVAAATAVADGSIRLDAGRSLAELTSELQALPGIGPWTANYVALRVLKSPDLLLTGDVAVRAGARALGLPDTPRELTAYAEPHRPWRSYLMMHLWRASAPPSPTLPPSPKEPS